MTSWSSIDYYGNRKALYYQAKRSYNKLLISFDEKGDSLQIFIVSDKLNTVNGKLLIALIDFKGRDFYHEMVTIQVEPNSSRLYFTISKNLAGGTIPFTELLLSVAFPSRLDPVSAIYYFSKPKELKLPRPNIKIKKINNYAFEISTDVLAKNVYLRNGDQELKLSDNFFDLLPGETKIITLEDANGNFDPVTLKVKSLYDTTIDFNANNKY